MSVFCCTHLDFLSSKKKKKIERGATKCRVRRPAPVFIYLLLFIMAFLLRRFCEINSRVGHRSGFIYPYRVHESDKIVARPLHLHGHTFTVTSPEFATFAHVTRFRHIPKLQGRDQSKNITTTTKGCCVSSVNAACKVL